VARLGDAIAQRAAGALAGLTDDVRQVVHERRELAARMLDAVAIPSDLSFRTK
jgi:hypothetical protein